MYRLVFDLSPEVFDDSIGGAAADADLFGDLVRFFSLDRELNDFSIARRKVVEESLERFGEDHFILRGIGVVDHVRIVARVGVIDRRLDEIIARLSDVSKSFSITPAHRHPREELFEILPGLKLIFSFKLMREESAEGGLDDVFGVDFGSDRIGDPASRQFGETIAQSTMDFGGGGFVAAA